MNDLKKFLLPYQRDYVLDNSKTALYIKSRRVGITYAEALRAVLRRLENPFDYSFVSANARTSIEMINYTKMFCEVINAAVGQDYIDLSDSTTEVIRFPNGSKIIALSSNPTALRGRGGDICLDEFSFSDCQEELLKAAMPVCMWNGNLRIISSMSSPDSYFSQLVSRVERKELPWKLFKTTIYDAVNDGLARKIPGQWQNLLPDIKSCDEAFIKSLKEEVGSDAIWSQEFCCEPSTQSTLISTDEYDKLVISEVPEKLDPNKKYGDLFIGVDIGRVKDLTVIWVLERGYDKEAQPHLRDVFRTVAVKAVKGMPFEAQYQLISQYLSLPNMVKCCIDRSGLGLQLAEQLVDEHGTLVEGVAISSPTKQSLVERTLKFISQQRVSLPKDPLIKSDIINMRRIVTAKGNVSYDGRSDIGHCDHFIALAMALRAADKTSSLELTTR